MIPATLQELFSFNDWARDRLLAAAAERTDEELDRPFEMGEGSLRKTVCHLWGAEECWLSRWQGLPCSNEDDEQLSVQEVVTRSRDTAERREAWLKTQDAASLDGTLRYKRPKWMGDGPDMELNLGVSVLHILNHGIHHRTQAVNMLKRLGATPPALDYIVMRLNGETPELDMATVQRYLSHGDWAYQQVQQAGAALSDAARNQEFPIGPGTLTRIMRHLADAPDWWMDNIANGPGQPFPAIEEGDSWDDLWTRYAKAAQRRTAYLQDADLKQPIRVVGRGAERTFSLGVAMLQLCGHGTHHRAQALNMLRHTGAKVPGVDVAVWQRAGAPDVLSLASAKNS